MMSTGDVAVMTSPRADVNWCRSGKWRRVKKVPGVWRHVNKVLGAWRHVKKFVGTWKRMKKLALIHHVEYVSMDVEAKA